MRSLGGTLIALLILTSWGALISIGLTATNEFITFPVGMALVALITFLYTGLFITGHDGMHRTLCPASPRVNDFLGSLCVRLYALFSYRRLCSYHRRHHEHPGTESDPDFSNGGVFAWYFIFMRRYVTVMQLLGMAVVFNVLSRGFGIAEERLILFWVLPALLSTVQLFYFGTYLPHRPNLEKPFDDDHRARSLYWSWTASFLACYHFGYHHEHHEYPGTPWWLLPSRVRQER